MQHHPSLATNLPTEAEPLWQSLEETQAQSVAGGFGRSIEARIAALNASAAPSEPSGTVLDCLVSDIGGDAVVFEGPSFFAKLPFLSLVSTPQ